MGHSDFDNYYYLVMGISLVMVVVSLLRFKKKGARMLYQGGGYLTLAAIAFGLVKDAPNPVLIALGVVLVFCLSADALLKRPGAKT